MGLLFLDGTVIFDRDCYFGSGLLRDCYFQLELFIGRHFGGTFRSLFWGLLRDCYGTVTGLLWDCYGTAILDVHPSGKTGGK